LLRNQAQLLGVVTGFTNLSKTSQSQPRRTRGMHVREPA
jgi:hypothetical protein